MWLASWFKNRKQAGKPSNILPNPRLVVGYDVKRCSRCPWSFHMKIRLENPKRSVHISFYIDETNKSYYIWRLKIIDPKNRCREDETGPMWSKLLVPKLDPVSGWRFRLAPYLGVYTPLRRRTFRRALPAKWSHVREYEHVIISQVLPQYVFTWM